MLNQELQFVCNPQPRYKMEYMPGQPFTTDLFYQDTEYLMDTDCQTVGNHTWNYISFCWWNFMLKWAYLIRRLGPESAFTRGLCQGSAFSRRLYLRDPLINRLRLYNGFAVCSLLPFLLARAWLQYTTFVEIFSKVRACAGQNIQVLKTQAGEEMGWTSCIEKN